MRPNVALRPAVVARKTWGGNRTEADAPQILMTVLQTRHRQGKDSFERIGWTLARYRGNDSAHCAAGRRIALTIGPATSMTDAITYSGRRFSSQDLNLMRQAAQD
jgi:hypothetical protein